MKVKTPAHELGARVKQLLGGVPVVYYSFGQDGYTVEIIKDEFRIEADWGPSAPDLFRISLVKGTMVTVQTFDVPKTGIEDAITWILDLVR